MIEFTVTDEVHVWQSMKPVFTLVETRLPSGAVYKGAWLESSLKEAYASGVITIDDLEPALHELIVNRREP